MWLGDVSDFFENSGFVEQEDGFPFLKSDETSKMCFSCFGSFVWCDVESLLCSASLIQYFSGGLIITCCFT